MDYIFIPHWSVRPSNIPRIRLLKLVIINGYEVEAEKANEEDRDFLMPNDREIGADIEFPMKLDPATKHFICKRCGLYATREQVYDIREKLNQRELTKEDKHYDYLEWWQKSKKDK